MPKASIEICNARGRSARRTVKQLRRLVTLVGWSRRCKVRLKHESVSRVHCAFVLTARGVWVIDLLGRGGTLVNGDVVQYAKLDEGDDVCVGEFHLRVCYGRSLRRRRVGGMSESFVLSLVDRFAAMQQQMFEQQHDQMLLLTQMFGAIHHSQHELIRDDLRRLHEITRELQQVQSELLRRQAGSPFESGAAAPRSGEPNVTDPIQHEQPPSATPQGGPPAKLPEFHDALRESAASISDEAEREAASIGSVDEGEAAANSQMDPAGRSEAASPPEAVPEKEAEFGDPPADDSGPAAEAENAEPPVAEETSPTEPAAEGPHAADGIESSIDAAGAEAGRSTPVDDHAWLQHRLRVLERERNSLWRKITRTLSGGGA